MGRRRSFINRSVGPFTFIFLCFRHFHVQRATVLFCPRRRSQAGEGSRSLMGPPLTGAPGAKTPAGEPSPAPPAAPKPPARPTGPTTPLPPPPQQSFHAPRLS